MKKKPGTRIVSNLFLVSVGFLQECSRGNIDSYLCFNSYSYFNLKLDIL